MWNDIGRLRHIARTSRCRFHIRRRGGWRYIKEKGKKRKTFLAGCVFFIAILCVVPSFVFRVEVKSLEPLTEIRPQEVLEWAAEQGIMPGTYEMGRWILKKAAHDLTLAMPRLSWAGIEAENGRVIIRIVEKNITGRSVPFRINPEIF